MNGRISYCTNIFELIYSYFFLLWDVIAILRLGFKAIWLNSIGGHIQEAADFIHSTIDLLRQNISKEETSFVNTILGKM